MNPSMKILYTCMLDDDIHMTHVFTTDPDFFLRIDFYDSTGTSIGFYEKNGKIGVKSFIRDGNERRNQALI